MEKSKRVKLYFHDTRSEVETPKENYLLKSIKPFKEQEESSPSRINERNLDPMDEGSAKQESSTPTS